MGIAAWKTWPTDGPLSPRPGTMHQQTSNSAIPTVEGPLSHKRRPTTWQCESHSEASPATAGNRWAEPWPCGPSGTHADRNATGNSLGAPLWQKADPPDLDDGGPASNSTAGRPRLGCPVEGTVQALCTGWGWLDCQQVPHLSTTGPGWETHQDIQEGDSRWMGKGGTTRRQLEHMHLVFRTNLLMAILSFPNMPKLNITHRDLEDWYRWFWGKDIADRRPPSEQVLLYAERTRGERSTTWSTGGWASKKPCYNYDKTPYSGQGRSMSQWHGRKDTKAQLGQTPRHDRPSPRDDSLRGRQLSHSGTNKKDRPKGARPKGPWDLAKERTLNGPPTGLRSHLRECGTVVITSSRRPRELWTIPQVSGPQEWLVCNAAPSEHNPEQCPNRWLLVDPVASCTVHPPRLTDNSTPINTHATTEPGGPPPHCHNGTITPHPQPEAVGRPRDTTETMVGQALLGRCPWLSSVPHRLLERLTWITQPTAGLQGRDILLYTVPRDGGALDDILTQQQQDLGPRLLAVDILRPPETGPNDIMVMYDVCGGRPRLQNMEHPTMVPQTWSTQASTRAWPLSDMGPWFKLFRRTVGHRQGQYPFAPPNGDHRPGLQSQAVQRFPLILGTPSWSSRV